MMRTAGQCSMSRAFGPRGLRLALAGSMLMLAGCKPKPLALEPPPSPEQTPSLRSIVAAHNERAARLTTTTSDGVIELSWTDERGRHTDQGDLDFWQTTDNRTALRLSKLGEVGLWLGSSGDQWWLFDRLAKDDHVLYRGTREQAFDRFGIGVTPWGLMDLLGMTSIEVAGDLDVPAPFDATQRAWVVVADGRGGRLHMEFELVTLFPKRIELLDAAGQVVATSSLRRYESVEVPNTAIMARPKMPLTIDIHREAMADGEFAGDVKIAFNSTIGEISERQAKRIFNIDALIASMEPDRVVQAADAP
jgi:hypothetical protein